MAHYRALLPAARSNKAPPTTPQDNPLDSSVSNDLIDNRRPAGNARSTHDNRLPKPTQDSISTHLPAMQTYVVREPSQQTFKTDCLPSQPIQALPPTSTSRLDPNSDAQGPGYLTPYQLGSRLGTSALPFWCWPRDPDAKPYDDVAGADKLDMNRNRRIQGQKRFCPQRGELDIKTWDAWNYFYECNGSVVDLVDFGNEDLRWCIMDDDQTHNLKVVGYPTEVNLGGRL